jgi:hypothetical protein
VGRVVCVAVDAWLLSFKLRLMGGEHCECRMSIVPRLSERLRNHHRSQPKESEYQTPVHDTKPSNLWRHNVSLQKTPIHINLDDHLTSLINCGPATAPLNSHGFCVIGIPDKGRGR